MNYTIVIPVYNKEETLYRAVESAFNQTLSPQCIIVVDDASTDHSLQQLEPFIDDPRLQLIQLKQNVGISKVLNTALQQVRTPYFIQLDGDDWLEPEAGHELVTALERRPEAAFSYANHQLWIYSNHQDIRPAKQVIQPPFHSKYDFLLKLGYMLNPRCYRTDSVHQVGGWETDDPWEGRYFEDGRMVIKLASSFTWVHVPQILHNVLIDQKKSDKKIPMYNTLRKTFYEKMLKHWGDHYQAVWRTASTGRLILQDLVPTRPSTG